MPENSLLRDNRTVWNLRVGQLVLNIIAFVGVGVNAASWNSLDCNIPPNVALGIAVCSICLPVLIYLVPTTGGPRQCVRLPWNQWVQLGLDVMFVVLWLAAIVGGQYHCSSLCQACSAGWDAGYGFAVYAGSLTCDCYAEDDFRRSLHEILQSRSADYGGVTNGKLVFRIISQVIILLEFVATLGLDIYFIMKHRKQYNALPGNAGYSMGPMAPMVPPKGPDATNVEVGADPNLNFQGPYAQPPHQQPSFQQQPYQAPPKPTSQQNPYPGRQEPISQQNPYRAPQQPTSQQSPYRSSPAQPPLSTDFNSSFQQETSYNPHNQPADRSSGREPDSYGYDQFDPPLASPPPQYTGLRYEPSTGDAFNNNAPRRPPAPYDPHHRYPIS